jgi:hypothetical protein
MVLVELLDDTLKQDKPFQLIKVFI